MNNCLEFVRSAPRRLFAREPCALCGLSAQSKPGEVNKGALCPSCWRDLPWLGLTVCPRCAQPTPNGAVCGACLKHPPRFDATRAALRYQFPLAPLLHAYKYRSQLALTRTLAHAMLQTPPAQTEVLVPLPVSAARLRDRGFNQAAELAKLLSRALKLPVEARALRKVRETRAQTELPWDERHANVRGAFACDATLAGKRIALIDDVMTTGATADEASKALKQAGAAEVQVWVLARALAPG